MRSSLPGFWELVLLWVVIVALTTCLVLDGTISAVAVAAMAFSSMLAFLTGASAERHRELLRRIVEGDDDGTP